MINLNTQLSALTNLPKTLFDTFTDKSNICIANEFYNNISCGEPITSVDIGIGKLSISYQEGKILYKFIPTKALETKLVNVVKQPHSELISALEKSISDAILNTYKEYF